MHEIVVWFVSLPIAVLIALLVIHQMEQYRRRRDARNWKDFV